MVKKVYSCRWSKKTAVSVVATVLVILMVGLVGEVTWLVVRATRRAEKARVREVTFSTPSATTVSARITTGESHSLHTHTCIHTVVAPSPPFKLFLLRAGTNSLGGPRLGNYTI